MRRRLKCLALLGWQSIQRTLHFGFGQLQISHPIGYQAIKFIGVFDNRRVAPHLHVGQNPNHGALDTFILRRLKGKQGIHFCREIGVDRSKSLDSYHLYFSTA
jgi:hypothetical protein